MDLKYINSPWNEFSNYLKKKYGGKVYKLPVNLPATCPNRDGTIGKNGCIFCGGEGAGFAGGIISSAVDGIKVAEKIMCKYKPF